MRDHGPSVSAELAGTYGWPSSPQEEGAAPVHPCPICLENEDQTIQGGRPAADCMCRECGRSVCFQCALGLSRADNLSNKVGCPICRAPGHGGPPNGAGEEYKRMDFARTKRLVTERDLVGAGLGHLVAEAQFTLGTMYCEGRGCDIDKAEGHRWYRAAANNGHAVACFNLGNACRRADFGCRLEEHTEWYSKAAELVHPRALLNMGAYHTAYLYLDENIPLPSQDPGKAVECYRKVLALRPEFCPANWSGRDREEWDVHSAEATERLLMMPEQLGLIPAARVRTHGLKNTGMNVRLGVVAPDDGDSIERAMRGRVAVLMGVHMPVESRSRCRYEHTISRLCSLMDRAVSIKFENLTSEVFWEGGTC